MKNKLIYFIPIILLIIIIIYYNYNYIYYKNEYYIDGLIYSSRDSTLLNGVIIDYEQMLNSTRINVKDGYIVGEYEQQLNSDEVIREVFLNNTKDLNFIKKILSTSKVSILLEIDSKEHLSIIVIEKNKDFYNANFNFNLITEKINLLQKYFKHKYNLKTIMLFYKDNILKHTQIKYILFSFKNDNLEYYVYNRKKYKILGESAIYVPK